MYVIFQITENAKEKGQKENEQKREGKSLAGLMENRKRPDSGGDAFSASVASEMPSRTNIYHHNAKASKMVIPVGT